MIKNLPDSVKKQPFLILVGVAIIISALGSGFAGFVIEDNMRNSGLAVGLILIGLSMYRNRRK